MSPLANEGIVIDYGDLDVATTIMSSRFEDPRLERERLTLVDELLRVERNLGRRLSEHARHALSESRGSHSTWDVVADAELVYAALVEYAATVGRTASASRRLLATATHRDDSAASTMDSRYRGADDVD